jgi:hypothetical protein
MNEHEEIAEQGEREADDLEHRGEQLEEAIEGARAKAEEAAQDQFIATPAPKDVDEGGEESDYPTKD